MDDGIKRDRPKNLRQNANPLSIIFLTYTIPMFLKGYKITLEEKDLPQVLTHHESGMLGNKIEAVWKEEEITSKKAKRKPSLLRVITKVFYKEFLFYGLVYGFSELVVRLVQPIAIGRLIHFYSSNNDGITIQDAYAYAWAVIACSLLSVFCMHPYMLGCAHLGMKMRVACCSLIYRKALKLSKISLGQTTVGQLVNLLSNDVNRFDVGMLFAHSLWVGPIETIIITYIMYLEIEYSAMIGVASLLIFIPLQIFLGNRMSKFRINTASRTDERVRLMNEIISGIQVIKMYSWEMPFQALVSTARRVEIKSLRGSSYIRGVIFSFIMFTTRMATFVSVLSYVLLGNQITAEKVFVITSSYGILRQTMTVFFPQCISQLAELNVSINRLNTFLLYEENDLISNSNKTGEVNENGITVKNITAKWNPMSHTLNNVSFSVHPGKLVAIIGPVGSGKSSLLQAILKELPLKSGSIDIRGEISYASQEPWLFTGSVRQNILFGLPMNKARYRTVVKICSLETDFQLLPFGDRTLVGERGVTLSGGQRARINLARAVYKKADIYLLDDPLSAVDAHVGKALFEECITGYLKEKTVILITHQLQFLKDVDDIIILKSGSIEAVGDYRSLRETGLDFAQLLDIDYRNPAEIVDNESMIGISIPNSVHTLKSCISDLRDEPHFVEEQKSMGSVGCYVYKSYFSAGGTRCFIVLVFFLFILAQISGSAGDYFISYWVNLEQLRYTNDTSRSTKYKESKFWNLDRNSCIYIYSTLTFLLIFLSLYRSFAFFSMCMSASMNLHNRMFNRITRATMYFFDTNPSGRILNRFSKDVGAIDELLPIALIDVVQIGLTLLGIIIVITIINPYLLIPLLLIGLLFYFLRMFYLATSRSIKRLEGVTRSPVFSHLNASLQGLTTIRAFKAQKILEKEFDMHQDLHSSAWYLFISTSRAFGLWLDLICVIYIALVTLSFLVLGKDYLGGNVGLAITQSIAFTGISQWGMRQSTELENQMTSVERVLEYCNIDQERAFESDEGKKLNNWPIEGEVTFRHVFLKYSADEPPVLKDLNFTIKPSEKVGIVGRTGAGKSSLLAALFQLTEIDGSIVIDGVDTKTLGLHELRSKISIIPQEPVLFSGTMRNNLDPFDEYSDDVLWKALEDVELKDTVSDLGSGLNSYMSEGGSNFSIGQRQLVCLARAIVRQNKILVLDEATANVDPHTDSLIQTTIRTTFAGCTVLTIAHRLHTVMDSDKVLVMDAGRMVEFDHPHILLQNETGLFYSMVQQTGSAMSESLKNIAKYYFNHKEELKHVSV